jgi:two-component system, OmpR family, KDP operon response regulator KdpE
MERQPAGSRMLWGRTPPLQIMPKSANSVLVIDDEPQIRRFVTVGLELHGFTVKVADCGLVGLDAAARMKPDVIVLDLGLPDMSGIEVLESIRAWSNVPVIVLSIDSREEQKVLARPFAPPKLSGGESEKLI